MSRSTQDRRDFLKNTAGILAGGAVAPYWLTARVAGADETKSKNDRLQVGAIGVGPRGTTIAGYTRRHGDVVAVCDVYLARARAACNSLSEGKATVCQDYRELLEQNDVDVVTIGTTEHWHSKIAIEAMKAGKDVYCEKPLTLTIDEGKQLCRVAKETERVFQVGTQQRSGEYGGQFPMAVAMVRDGRIGKVRRATVSIPGPGQGGPFQVTAPPVDLDWDFWLGQAPEVPYMDERYSTYRWWYEYAGGNVTDWGVHHVDVVQWALGLENSGPVSVEGTGTIPNVVNGSNTAVEFDIKCRYATGTELVIKSDAETNGILFEGDKGRFFVNRGKLVGKPVEQLQESPLSEDAVTKLYPGYEPGSRKPGFSPGHRPGPHMQNFFDCVRSRRQPISDVFTCHRTMTTLHLANICIRLGRKLTWDPKTEQIIGDDEANAWQRRAKRKGYEIVA